MLPLNDSALSRKSVIENPVQAAVPAVFSNPEMSLNEGFLI
jgi:hypothetical protein